MKSESRTIIVGAGVAGLTLGYRLAARGVPVLVLEKEDDVGGLARSFQTDGFVFDIGPHRFYSEIPEVMAFVHEVLDGDMLTISRRSGVRMFGRYIEWPLALTAILRFPPEVLLRVAYDFVRTRERSEETFETYIIGRYGRTLYEIFFRPYTEKFLGLPSDAVSRDWAAMGIDRAAIDPKMKVDDLLSLAGSLFTRRRPLQFVYPKSGGIGVFCAALTRRIREAGGEVITAAPVEAIRTDGERISGVSAGGREYTCRNLVWTGPIGQGMSLLHGPVPDLSYRSLLIYAYRVAEPPRLDYQWCYFGAADIPFNRVSIPFRFNPALSPPGHTGVCVEVTCRKGDAVWESPEDREPLIRRAMAATGVIGDERNIDGYVVKKVAEAYPVYTLNYAEKVAEALRYAERFSNLKFLGRTAAFWYNNMDHSIEKGLALARELSA